LLRKALVRARKAKLTAVTQCRARLGAIQALQDRLAGQGDVSEWLHRRGLTDLAPFWRALHVEAGWELAVEAVLRERIVARGPLVDEALLGCLADAAPANLCFLRAHSVRAEPTTDLALPPLASLVRCEHQALAGHLQAWLSSVYAVDELTSWIQSGRQLPPGVRLVTRQGQILTVDSLNLFAPDAQTHGAIERQREIEDLSEQIAATEIELAAAQHELGDVTEQLANIETGQAAAQQHIKHLQSSVYVRTLAFVKAQEQQARFDERVSQLAREIADIAHQETLERAHLDKASENRQAAEALMSELRLAVYEALQQAASTEENLRTARATAEDRRRQKQEAELVVREGEVKLGELIRNQGLAAEQRQKIACELAGLKEEDGELDEGRALASLQTALDMRHSREASLAQRRAEQEEALLQLRRLEEGRIRVEHALEPLREKLSDLRLRSQAAELVRAQAAERLAELGAETIELESSAMAEIKEASLSREVTRLTRELAELGPVNLAALVELEATRARALYLERQYQDLTGAIDTLESAIRKIDRETREQLKTTFETVNSHFGALFPRLFGGGQAELLLTGDEILDAGVQIVAQPPGKKNTSIHLLSGGEKALTAIALVFAMFQLNPAPFCMLDEVDAPLDDANTERYCEMVRHMSSVTQFVFISHSKITMEMARQLIGVTMQEQGVSRVVEVDMDEALKLAQPAAA
jgi:chromosome segregation protein